MFFEQNERKRRSLAPFLRCFGIRICVPGAKIVASRTKNKRFRKQLATGR